MKFDIFLYFTYLRLLILNSNQLRNEKSNQIKSNQIKSITKFLFSFLVFTLLSSCVKENIDIPVVKSEIVFTFPSKHEGILLNNNGSSVVTIPAVQPYDFNVHTSPIGNDPFTLDNRSKVLFTVSCSYLNSDEQWVEISQDHNTTSKLLSDGKWSVSINIPTLNKYRIRVKFHDIESYNYVTQQYRNDNALDDVPLRRTFTGEQTFEEYFSTVTIPLKFIGAFEVANVYY